MRSFVIRAVGTSLPLFLKEESHLNRWLEVTVETSASDIDALAARLTMNGADGLVLEDEADFRRFLEENRQYWDYVDDALLEQMRGVARIRFYVPDSTAGRTQMETVLRGIDAPSSVRPVREEDWAYRWQAYYQPMEVGEKLYILPEWERSRPVPPGRTAVCLNPGLTFGTGAHASTQLCLELLEKWLSPGGTVLDLGCGSGILSIAALRLGAAYAVGVDVDPKAADAARENAALNGIDETRYTTRTADILTDRACVDALASSGPYPIVLANIVADVILSLSQFVGRFLSADGVFLCSGILDTRREEVEAGLRQNGMYLLECRERNGWCALVAARTA